MAKQIDFFDGAQSSTTPTIGNIDTTSLLQYANDATYEAANLGSPTSGNIYFNTTVDLVRYYNGTAWVNVLDEAGTQTLENKTIDGTSATGNNTVLTDADDISFDNVVSGLTATDAQAAIDEVEARVESAETDIVTNTTNIGTNTTDIANLETLTGVAGATTLGTFTGVTIPDDQNIKAALQALETAVESVGGALVFVGTWNANTNSPALVSSAGTQGEFYIVSIAGTTSLDGISDWGVNDWAIFDGTVWRKVDNSELVTSVNGQTGAASLSLDNLNDVSAGTPAAREEIRRNVGNTEWENFNPDSVTIDAASTGANAVLGAVTSSVVQLTNVGLVSVDEVTSGYSGQKLILANKSTVAITINNETGSTAANRILTGTSGPIELTTNASVYLTYDSTSARWRVIGGQGGAGSGVTGVITGNNSTANSTIGDWITYQDAAASVPVDGTGGTPNVTLTRTTTASEVQNGNGSFKLTKGAFNRQGEGISLTLAVPNYLKGQPVQFKLSYDASVNFSYGNPFDLAASPSDVMIYAYDVTNGGSPITPFPNALSGGKFTSGAFQIPTTCSSIRLIFHIATTNALAWDLFIDNIELSLAPNDYANGIINDTASVTGFTSRSGTNVLFATTLKTPTVGLIQISTALGYTQFIARAKILVTATFNTQYTTSLAFTPALQARTAADVEIMTAAGTFVDANSSGTGATLTLELNPGEFIRVVSSVNFTNNLNCNFSITAQTVGFGYFHPASVGLNPLVVFRAFKNGGAITGLAVVPSWTTVQKDTTGSFNSSTGIYTVRNPGDYYVHFNCQQAVTNTNGVSVYLNGTLVAASGIDASSVFKHVSTNLVNLKYGDTIDVRNTLTGTVASNNTGTYLSIHKIGSEAQPYAPRIAYVKDVKAASTAGGTFTSGAWQTRTLNTLEGDVSFISLSANQIVLQPGTYHIEASAPAFKIDNHVIKLRNITDAVDTIIGAVSYADAASNVQNNSLLNGTFTIASAKTFETQHRCTVTRASNGFGAAGNVGVSEIYATVKLTKVL